MQQKKIVKIFFIFLFFLIITYLVYLKFSKTYKTEVVQEKNNTKIYHSNIVKDVEYTTKDKEGNQYSIKAKEGEIDFSNPNIIFLTKVQALIKLIDSNEISIVSDFGKYNSENYETIFSKNVIINYLENKISGEYLDFSLERNSMIISKNVIYNNMQTILKSDVIEIDINSKTSKIFMYEKEKKVNIKSKK